MTLVALNDRERFARQGWPSWPKKLVPFPGGRLLVDRAEKVGEPDSIGQR